MKKKKMLFFLFFVTLIYGSYIFIPPVVTKYYDFKYLKDLSLEVKKLKYAENDYFEYLEGGKGETLIFVHGFQSSKNFWMPYFKRLIKDYNVIAMDLPGHGNSSRPKTQKYDLQSMALSLDIFIEKKNLSNFHLIGTSMGGGIISVYAYNHPEKIKSLVLINPLGIDQEKKSDLQKLMDKGKNVFFPNTITEFDEMMMYVFGKHLNLSVYFKKYFLHQMSKNYAFFKKVFNEMLLKTRPLDNILPKITTPALILIGQKDKIIHPASYEYFVRLMPHATAVRFPNGSHVFLDVYLEQAVKAIDRFVKAHQEKHANAAVQDAPRQDVARQDVARQGVLR